MASQLKPRPARVKNQAATAFASKNAAALVTGVTKRTREALRDIITRSVREGMSPAEVARDVREMIGMSRVQAQAAMNYRASLKGVVPQRKAMLMERYIAQKVRERAVTIARFEVMNALNGGQLESWLDRQREGELPKGARKSPMVTSDVKACGECRSVSGRKYKLDAEIRPGRQHPPFHPRCRCAITLHPGGRSK